MGVTNLVDAQHVDSLDTLSKISAAVHLGTFDSSSDEWHALRATGIGGSEVGTICGLNRWESPFTLWAKKLGKIESRIEQSEAMEWGNRLEPVILEKFADSHPELSVFTGVGTWSNVERPWQVANPDALYETLDGRLGVVEVKTAQYEDDWADGVPRHYETQVQWYLQTFNLSHAYVVALFHGNRYREFEVSASSLAQDAAMEQVERFRDHVVHEIEPDFDGALSTYSTVRALHPDIKSDSEVELGYLGEQYFSKAESLKKAEEDLTELKSRILDAMGDAKRGLVHGVWTFSRQARGTGTPYLVTKRG